MKSVLSESRRFLGSHHEEKHLRGQALLFATEIKKQKARLTPYCQLSELFPAKLASIGHATYNNLIDSLLQGNVNPLANALVNQEKIEAQHQIDPQFPHSSTHFIAAALDDGGTGNSKIRCNSGI
ncbi:hypothetical protein [Legionella fairfieldensis]|uniref:hypothetical protein n=1 Tax=Legionella fairfieldensis TaxID=45064 RepID=UPI00048CD4D1|nr:hypothetical protein [Legionella fairfieldensis]